METAITIQKQAIPTIGDINALERMAVIAAMSGLLKSDSKDQKQRASDAFFIEQYGVELGIGPMTALRQIFMVKGTPALSANLMQSLMQRAGYKFRIPDPATVEEVATVAVKPPDEDEWYEYSFTMEMAKAAGLTDKGVWKQYRQAMLISRAISLACRYKGPDVLNGLYTVEEIVKDGVSMTEDGNYVVTGNIIASDFLSVTVPEPPKKDKGAFILALQARGIAPEQIADIKKKAGINAPYSEADHDRQLEMIGTYLDNQEFEPEVIEAIEVPEDVEGMHPITASRIAASKK